MYKGYRISPPPWIKGVIKVNLKKYFGPACLLMAIIGLALPCLAGESKISAEVGKAVDISQFGKRLAEAKAVGVEWINPRAVYEVHVLGVDAALADGLHVEWWGSIWPANGLGGWMRLDDQWNGKWVRVKTRAEAGQAGQLVFKFPPLTKKEWGKDAKPPMKKPPTYRQTLKVRVVAEGKALPANTTLKIFGNSHWREECFDIERRCFQDGETGGGIEITNGLLVNMESLPAPRAVKVEGTKWTARGIAGGSAGVRIKLRFAENRRRNSNDLTRVTVRLGGDPRANGFSFVPQDVLVEGAIHLPDFGVLVSETSRGITFNNYAGPEGKIWRRTVRGRIPERPEATRTSAMKGIPRLSNLQYAPLGAPSARQEIEIGPQGDWLIRAMSLNADNGRDNQRWSFKKKFGRARLRDNLFAQIDTREQPKFDGKDRDQRQRYLDDGYLPLVHVKWGNGPLHFHHACATTILVGDYGDDVTRRGDETVVLLTKLDITNTAAEPKPATVNLRWTNNTPIELQDDGMVALKLPEERLDAKNLTTLRAMISCDTPADGGVSGWKLVPGKDKKASAVLRWQATLQPNQTRTIYFKAPFVEQLDAKELTRLKKISFDKEIPLVLDYWRKRLAEGMVIEVPDQEVNNLYKACLWHNLITTDRDPETGLYNMGVGTWAYRVFGNETVMIARSMDMRGEFTEGERIIEPLLHYQGQEHLKGRFSKKEGVLHSAG
jgi:hypothetical protein